MMIPLGITTKPPYSLEKAQKLAYSEFGESIIKMQHNEQSNVLLVWLKPETKTN